MNNSNYLFENSPKSFKERRLLKIKLKKISNQFIKPNCDKYLLRMRDLKINQLNNSSNINNIIKQSINFHYGKDNNYLINPNINEINKTIENDLSEFDLNCDIFCKTLKMELSKPELQAVKSDELYYLPNNKIRNNIKILKEKLIYRHVNEEDKKRKYLSTEKMEKNIKNKNMRKYKSINSYNVIKKLKEINNQIKYGILNLKNEEKKKYLINERKKNIVKVLKSQATHEVNSLFNDYSKSPRFNINHRNKKYFIDEYTRYNHNIENERNKTCFYPNLIINKNIKKIDLSPNNKTFRKIYPIINTKNFKYLKEKNTTNIIKGSESLDSFKDKKINIIYDKSFKSPNNIEYSSSYKKSFDERKSNKIRNNDNYDDKNERKTLVLMTNKIKEIYEKNKCLENKNVNLRKIYKI